MPNRGYNEEDDVFQNVSFEMNLDLKVIARSTFSFLELLSVIGGFQASIMGIIGITLGLLDGNHLEQFMIRSLYKTKEQDKNRAKHKSAKPV